MSILRYGLCLIILSILINSLRKGKPENELTEEEKKQIKKNGGYRDVVKTKLAIALVLIGYIFISDTFKTEEEIKTEAIPKSVQIIENKSGIIDMKYEIKEAYGAISAFNLQINDDICKGLKYAISEKDVFKVNVKGVFQDGSFVRTDSYGNSEPVKNVVAFEATWWASDIKNYNCDNFPDVWKHATINNLWIEFRKMTRKDCEKENNYSKYFLCSKVM